MHLYLGSRSLNGKQKKKIECINIYNKTSFIWKGPCLLFWFLYQCPWYLLTNQKNDLRLIQNKEMYNKTYRNGGASFLNVPHSLALVIACGILRCKVGLYTSNT